MSKNLRYYPFLEGFLFSCPRMPVILPVSSTVTAQLFSAFAFTTWIVKSLYFLNPKFQAPSYVLWLNVQPGLCWTWSKTQKVGFLMTRLMYFQFNLAITDNNEVQSEAKKILSGQTTTLGQGVCVEISLRTAEGDTMVLEMWSICLDSGQCDSTSKSSHTTYNRMSIVLKSLLVASRATPAYKLSRRQGTCANDYVICYRIYLGDPQMFALGDGFEKKRVGSVPTPFGTISIGLAYRTKLQISPQKTVKESLFDVKDDHFKQDSSPKRPTTPKPCSQGYRR